MQLHLGPSDWEILGRTTCELFISVPPASDLGPIHGEFLTFSEWWMDKSVHNHFWAWSSTLVLPLPSCSYHLEKMEGKQEALPSPGQAGCEKRGHSTGFHSQLSWPSISPCFLLTQSLTPRCLPLSSWRSLGRSVCGYKGGHSPPPPCPGLFSEKTGPFSSAIQGLPPLWRIRSSFT